MKKKKIESLNRVVIDLNALKANFKAIQKFASRNQFNIPTRKQTKKRLRSPEHMLAIVKADAYGHGVERVAKALDQLDIGVLGVINCAEAVALRKQGIRRPILILENSLPQYADLICKHDLIATVCTHELAHALNKRAKMANKQIKVHVKVDTGMGRLGVWHKDALSFIEQISRFRHLIIHGIYTHFPVADTDKKFTTKQIDQLYQLVNKLDRQGLIIPYIHASNSIGTVGYKTHVLNMFRPGIMLYGIYPMKNLRKKINLKPVMSVYSKVIFIKDIQKGRSISYGRTFIAKKAMTVATVPIGYSDGYLRALSNKSEVLINKTRCRVLGRVTMNQIVVDVTKVKLVRLGTPVTIVGKEGKEAITLEELADHAKTISYELACSLGSQIPREYK